MNESIERMVEPSIAEQSQLEESTEGLQVTSAWRKNIRVGAVIALAVLIANISLMAWANAAHEVEDGVSTVFEGNVHEYYYFPSTDCLRILL